MTNIARIYKELPSNNRVAFIENFKARPNEDPAKIAEEVKDKTFRSLLVSFRADPDLHQAIDEFAGRLGIKRSEAVARLVREALSLPAQHSTEGSGGSAK